MTQYIIKKECKDYDKASKQLKQTIDKALDKLIYLIEQKEKSGVSFEKIFNDDIIKYDILENNFFTFKFRYKDQTQLRLLYKFSRQNDIITIELHKFVIKRRTNKDYIKQFEKYSKEFQ